MDGTLECCEWKFHRKLPDDQSRNGFIRIEYAGRGFPWIAIAAEAAEAVEIRRLGGTIFDIGPLPDRSALCASGESSKGLKLFGE